MAGISGAYVLNGRIIYPEGTKVSDIKPFCDKNYCPVYFECHGPDSKGYADLDIPGETDETDLRIFNTANCI